MFFNSGRYAVHLSRRECDSPPHVVYAHVGFYYNESVAVAHPQPKGVNEARRPCRAWSVRSFEPSTGVAQEAH